MSCLYYRPWNVELRSHIFIDGRISTEPVAGADTVFDGGWILPGLVDAHCHVGLGDQGEIPLDEAIAQAQTERDAGALLLRWLEDGPLVVVSDRSGKSPRLKARLLATGQQGSFGESGERVSATLEETPSNSRELLAQVDFDPDSNAGMESMLGFRQDLGHDRRAFASFDGAIIGP